MVTNPAILVLLSGTFIAQPGFGTEGFGIGNLGAFNFFWSPAPICMDLPHPRARWLRPEAPVSSRR
jgi:hypothetical protein